MKRSLATSSALEATGGLNFAVGVVARGIDDNIVAVGAVLAVGLVHDLELGDVRSVVDDLIDPAAGGDGLVAEILVRNIPLRLSCRVLTAPPRS